MHVPHSPLPDPCIASRRLTSVAQPTPVLSNAVFKSTYLFCLHTRSCLGQEMILAIWNTNMKKEELIKSFFMY